MRKAANPDLLKRETALEGEDGGEDGGGEKSANGDAISLFLHFEMSALVPQALGSFKASSWVMLRFFNMTGLLKMPQTQSLSSVDAASDNICFIGLQHIAGAFSGVLKYG